MVFVELNVISFVVEFEVIVIPPLCLKVNCSVVEFDVTLLSSGVLIVLYALVTVSLPWSALIVNPPVKSEALPVLVILMLLPAVTVTVSVVGSEDIKFIVPVPLPKLVPWVPPPSRSYVVPVWSEALIVNEPSLSLVTVQ